MKTALVLVAVAALLTLGTASAATAVEETPAPASEDGRIYCAHIVEPVCHTYYWYCRYYLNWCPLQ